MPWEKQFNKDEALEKALAVFWERGYEATSMQDLIDCMGINRGSLYATFGDKHTLFVAALDMYDQRRHRLLGALERRHPPREAIRQVFRLFVDGVEDNVASKGCFLTNCALELAAHDASVGSVVAKAQQDVEEFFVRMIRKGKADGTFPSHVKPTEVGRGLLAALLGLLVLVRSRPERTLLQSIVSDALSRLD